MIGQSELRRELARQEHELQHKIIRDFVGEDLEQLLYPECFREKKADD